MAASLAAAEIIFLRGLLREMGVDLTEPTTLFVDNQGAEALAKDRRSCQRSRHIERRYLKVREWVHHGEIRVVYVSTDQNPADLLTKSLERGPFDRHVSTLSGGGATSSLPTQPLHAARAADADSSDPLSIWEAYFASSVVRLSDPTESAPPEVTKWPTAAAFIAESPSANLLRVLAATAPDSFSSQLFATPFGTTEPTLLSAEPADFVNDYPSLRQAAASDDRDGWEHACVEEYNNLDSHGAFEEVPEDSLPTWDERKGRASEVTDTLWVLRQKRGAMNEKTKKKGRICYNGAQQKSTAARNGTVIETFAPTVRH